METIIGIDLGTTNSEVAILKEGKPELIEVDGETIMPSCVAMGPDNTLLVGRAARNQMVAAPEATVLSVKRKMGTTTQIPLGEKTFTPEEISALILSRLKKAAQDHLGAPVSKAVITVPAYFDDVQRKATQNAGILAGMEIVRIINEPTAAAVAYDAGLEKDQVILVYDLGGGTFDASLVVVEKGVVEVKASHGDTHLGGDDFDQLLMKHVNQQFTEKTGAEALSDPRSRNRLWGAVETAKRKLTDAPFVRIREEYLVSDHHLDVEIERHFYEEMIRPLVRKTIDSAHQCLRDAAMLPKALDRIILVGGASRTPLVAKMIEDDFSIEPRHEINPDLIVAMGAAIQAGAIAGQPTHSVLVDITPHTFGTSVLGVYDGEMRPDVFAPIIRRNTPLPVRKAEMFQTVSDHQTQADVRIYQGESPLAEDNTFIGNFLIEGLSKVPAGNPIVFHLSLNLSGILEVTAEEKRTGLSKTVRMKTGEGQQGLDLTAARENLGDLIDLTQDPHAPGSRSGTPPKEALLTEAKRLRQRAEAIVEDVDETDAGEIKILISQSKTAITEGDMEQLAELNESLADMLFYLED